MKWAGGLAAAIVAVLLAGLSGWLVSQYVGIPGPPREQRPLAGLPLQGVAGSTVTVEEYRGKVVVLVFGCVSCWEKTGSVLGELVRVMRSLGGHADEVQVLVVSVAPDRDTAESVKNHVTASDPRFVGLVGSPELIQHVTALGLELGDPGAAPAVVLDQRGHLRLAFPFRFSAPSLAEDLAALMRPMQS